MSRARPDPIGVVERAYELDGDEQAWLQGVIDAARPMLDSGDGVVGFIHHSPPGGHIDLRVVAGSGVTQEDLAKLAPYHASVPPAVWLRMYPHMSGCTTSLGLMAKAGVAPVPTRRYWNVVSDFVLLSAYCDASGSGCVIGGNTRQLARVAPPVRRAWSRVAVHLGAGLRLRRALGGEPDAVLTASGKVEHAAGEAKDGRAREALRSAVASMEKARGKLRRDDPDAALEVWRGLVAGRWSLVEAFERSGRRYLVARKNEPGVEDPRALTARERQVIWYAALGHANKLIAYELGLSTSSVATLLARAMGKLGVATRAELVALVMSMLVRQASDA